MAVNTFTFNGINSLDKGLYVTGSETFNASRRDFEGVPVPGRNGDLLQDNHRYENIEITYPAIIIDDYEVNTTDIKAWLLSAPGYCRLADTYHPGYYRMGYFEGPIEFETLLLQAGSADLTFNCMPQRFLTSGETQIIIPSSGEIVTNPTLFDAKPLIEVTCQANQSGTIQIGNNILAISNLNTKTNFFIDCQDQIAYSTIDGGLSHIISMTPIGSFLKLAPGVNTITFTGCVSSLKITPRWWTL